MYLVTIIIDEHLPNRLHTRYKKCFRSIHKANKDIDDILNHHYFKGDKIVDVLIKEYYRS